MLPMMTPIVRTTDLRTNSGINGEMNLVSGIFYITQMDMLHTKKSRVLIERVMRSAEDGPLGEKFWFSRDLVNKSFKIVLI